MKLISPWRMTRHYLSRVPRTMLNYKLLLNVTRSSNKRQVDIKDKDMKKARRGANRSIIKDGVLGKLEYARTNSHAVRETRPWLVSFPQESSSVQLP